MCVPVCGGGRAGWEAWILIVDKNTHDENKSIDCTLAFRTTELRFQVPLEAIKQLPKPPKK